MKRWLTRSRISSGDSRAEAELFFEELVGGPETHEEAIGRRRTNADLFFAELTGEPLSFLPPPAVEQQDEQSPPGSALKDITRWDIFVPVPRDKMLEEAEKDIDPLALPPVEPSWRLDGLAGLTKSDPGHYIARKMAQLPATPKKSFDTRLYFCHPLEIRFFPYPTAEALAAAQGTVKGKPWYNQAPSPQVPLMGLKKPATTGDATFQKLLTAVNKRLVRAWMGELKRSLGNSGDLPKLVDWFGSDAGREHFRQWCQALGKTGGDRGQSNSAHGKHKAIDMNYEHNPWVPLCTTDGSSMTGEDHSRTKLKAPPSKPQDGLEAFRKAFNEEPSEAFKRCGRIYDRALRLFVPLVTTPEDPHGTRHFASTYYRIHHDWTPTRGARTAPPYTAEQVFGFYQILSWSLRFYFDYAYQQCSVVRTDDNTYSSHSKPTPDQMLDVWKRIEQDWKDRRLSPTAELHITDRASIPESVRGLFDTVELTYSFQRAKETVARFSFRQRMDSVTTDDQRRALAEVVFKQLEDDHDKMSRGMVTVAPSRRDPCNGVFNHSFEVVMAFCYMLTDPDSKKLRAFGAFTSSAGGDMQHFDYGHTSR